MFVQHLAHIFPIVLAGNYQDVTTRVKAQQVLLEFPENRSRIRIAQLYALNTIFAQDTSPKRMIEIQNYAFDVQVQDRLYMANVRVADVEPILLSCRYPHRVVQPRIPPALDSVSSHEVRVVQQICVWKFFAQPRQIAIELIDEHIQAP